MKKEVIIDDVHQELLIAQKAIKYIREMDSKKISTKEIYKLEDKIDTPMKKVVALFNLLQLETIWCCCGFNYKEDKTKDHVQGSPQVFIKADENSFKLLMKILDYDLFKVQGAWQMHLRFMQFQKPTFMISCHFPVSKGGMWDNPESPHFHERIVVNIKYLESRLLEFKDRMINEVVLKDTNEGMKEIIPYWNMLSGNNWIIKKKDWIGEHNEI